MTNNKYQPLVTHLCYAASAQTAAYRLHKSLLSIDIGSNMIVGSKSIIDKDILQPKSVLERLSAATGVVRELMYKKIIGHNNSPYFSINSGPELMQYRWLSNIANSNGRIIHLHWIGNGFLPIKRLSQFNKPIVWTMHDVWPFTGGCHVNGECDNYKFGCDACPQLHGVMQDGLASKMVLNKKAIYKDLDINVIAPSSWMESKVRKSLLLGSARIHRIPNALDITVYKPLNKLYSRNVLNINKNKKVIAFGAISALSDSNKGYDLLAAAIRKVSSVVDNLMVVIFGADNSLDVDLELGCEVKLIDRLSDDVSLSVVYSAADVVVVPSRQESYSQVSAESIACGTPVVAFNSTGPKDIIDHKINGYLAAPYEVEDLAAGIMWVLKDDKRRLLLSENARKKAIDFCSYEVVAKKHLDVYNELIDE